MTSTAAEISPVVVAGAPPIPGLRFRRFGGAADYPQMAATLMASCAADNDERTFGVDDFAHDYSHLTNCDLSQDMIIAEVNGDMVAYARTWWWEEANGPNVYESVGFVVPAWRRRGIGRAILRWLEQRQRSIAAGHPAGRAKFFQLDSWKEAVGAAALAQAEGYRPVRVYHEMLRPTLDNIPDFPLPAGLEVRPVLPEHYRAIWDAEREAFRDHWGFGEPSEADYQGWLTNKTLFQPQIWQVAWDVAGDQVAGMVRTYINDAENERFQRRRGYTEFISVRRPWRRRGLARALIARSLRVQRDLGMTESALGVDSENISGATRVYEACGFVAIKSGTVYRKELSEGPAHV
jgi:mycothiol synthase